MADDRAEDELHLRADQLRMLAHDLNNPLTAIRILAEMLHDEPPSPEMRQDLGDVLEAADLASALIEGMSSLMSLDLQMRPELTWFPMNLAQVLRDAVDRPALQRHVLLDLPDELPYGGDRRALTAAITDILLNARKLAEGEAPVELRAVAIEGAVEIEVRHPGLGIPPADREALLRRFGPVTLRRDRIPVCATGLAYAHHVISNHGGSLRFTDSPDGTMVLVVELPRP